MDGPHEIVIPEGMAAARGYSQAVVAQADRTVWIAGQLANDAAGNIIGATWTEQFDGALGNVVRALRAAGAEVSHVVSMQIFTTDVAAYKSAVDDLGDVYWRHLGRHYPAMALLGVQELVDPDALIEIMATAVIPDPPEPGR